MCDPVRLRAGRMKTAGRILIAAWFAIISPFAAGQQTSGDEPDIQRMRRMRVASEAITQIGYHRKSRTLEVRFSSGDVYRYGDFPPQAYRDFAAARSKGRHFQQHIRGSYRYWRVLQ